MTAGDRIDDGAGGGTTPPPVPRLFTVPPGRPFLLALAEAILSGDLPLRGGTRPAPLDLPDMTILLPTRRAARALSEAFLTAGGGRAMALPKIRPIADGDEDLSLLAGLASGDRPGSAPLDIPPAVSEIERVLVLTQFVQAWSKAQAERDGDDMAPVAGAGARTPAQAARLAGDLGRLIDLVETEDVSLDGLQDLVPENFSEHWQRTLDFLKIVTEFWPEHLAEQNLISATERRNRLILAEAERMAAMGAAAGPVIVAGVTGSVPATAKLMQVVAGLPAGALVLPALDKIMDEQSWQMIAPRDADHPGHPEHPQYGLKALLEKLGVSREDVEVLPGVDAATAQKTRAALISEAMRPAGSTAHWHEHAASADKGQMRAALEGVALLAAPTAQDEAEAIALILREAAQTPGKTAALVSPDRLLARRVAIRLESWGLRVDDSAGRPFAKTVPGAFLDLVIDAAASRFAPAALMALLQHPLARLAMQAIDIRRAAQALELAAFRAPYLGIGLDGVEAALARARQGVDAGERRGRAVRRLREEDWQAAYDLIGKLDTAFAPLTGLFASHDSHPLRDLARAHVVCAEALSLLPDETAPTALWQREAGEAASLFFTGLLDEAMPAPQLAAIDYPDFYRALIAGQNVRSSVPLHPRLSIWGPLEARLQQADVMILGGLNEGSWPAAADPGAWLNRPMRRQLGLPSPEAAIGRAAHDFTCFLGAPQVYLTRAAKIDGVPGVKSRWLMRIEAVLGGMDLADALEADQPWIGWARARDHIETRIAIKAPEPRPPVALRPRRLSVTAVERWIANPYAIFAGRILKLDPLPALGGEPDAGLRGAVIHEALSRFTKRYPKDLPRDIAGELMAIAADVLADYKAHPRVAAFWLPRFERFAKWFADKEPGWRSGITELLAEVDGSQVLDAPAGPFTLTARADRIDVGEAGLIITDYKTGQAPTDAKVLSGAAPQLPLEAAIAEAGGFAGLEAAPAAALRYIRATGGEPPGEDRLVKADDVSALAADALGGLARLVAQFDSLETPYKAVRRAQFAYDYDDYAQLARVAEWSGQSDEEA